MEGIEDIFKKSSTIADEARIYGNQLYIQKNHDQTIHKNILHLYTKSIAFAPLNSKDDELARAYGNRSALLMHLKQYDKCLIDIDRALIITNSIELRVKLESRRKKCVDALKNSSNVNEVMKNLSMNDSKNLPIFKRSITIPSASESVAVKYNEKFGRHLIATRNIKPGELIFMEKGYISFPIIIKRYLICSHCLSFAWNAIPCDHCAFLIYCSENCKKDAWNEYHDVECDLLPFVPSSIFERERFFLPYLMVALRLLIKAVKSEGIDTIIEEFDAASSGKIKGFDELMVNGKLRSDMFRSCANLLSNKDPNKNKHSANDDLNITRLIDALFRHTKLFNVNDDCKKIVPKLQIMLKKLTDIVDDNVFEYQAFVCECDVLSECRTKCDSSRGAVFAPVGSLVNHSCNSNVSRMFLPNGQVVMFTVAPVRKGEQLFVNYGTLHTEDKEDRQQTLEKFFHFTCKCQACEEDWPSDSKPLELPQDKEAMVFMKIMKDFQKHFPPSSKNSTIIHAISEDDWQYDEETLKHAVKLSELTYQHFNDFMVASYYNMRYKNYISTAFNTLYGEKFTIPNKC